MPTVIHKKSTRKSTTGLLVCVLCKKIFDENEEYRVVEEDGPYDNDWYAICKPCVAGPKYPIFMNNNCVI